MEVIFPTESQQATPLDTKLMFTSACKKPDLISNFFVCCITFMWVVAMGMDVAPKLGVAWMQARFVRPSMLKNDVNAWKHTLDAPSGSP